MSHEVNIEVTELQMELKPHKKTYPPFIQTK